MKQYSIGCMLLLLVLIILFGVSTQYRDGFKDEQDDQDQDDQDQDQDEDEQDPGMDSSMSSLRRQLPPMVSSCVKDGLRQFDDLQ